MRIYAEYGIELNRLDFIGKAVVFSGIAIGKGTMAGFPEVVRG
jgi:hypothetical protein